MGLLERGQRGHRDGQRLEPRSVRAAGRAGAVQPGAEKAPGRPDSRLPAPKGADRKAGEGLFTRAGSDGTRGVALN